MTWRHIQQEGYRVHAHYRKTDDGWSAIDYVLVEGSDLTATMLRDVPGLLAGFTCNECGETG